MLELAKAKLEKDLSEGIDIAEDLKARIRSTLAARIGPHELLGKPRNINDETDEQSLIDAMIYG